MPSIKVVVPTNSSTDRRKCASPGNEAIETLLLDRPHEPLCVRIGIRGRPPVADPVVGQYGCDLSALPAPRGHLQRWDEVPAPSEDFAAADEAIRKRVVARVEELLA